MKKPFAWSYSALSAFETCPRQYHEMRVLKRWPDPPGEAQLYGIQVHKSIENRIKSGTPLPDYLHRAEPIVQSLEGSKGVVQAEYKLALNSQFKPVEFFARDCWVRAVGDVIKIHENRSLQLDWKTGKFRDGDDQLKLQAAVSFATYPHVDDITVVYAWLKEDRTTVRRFARDQSPQIWQDFLPRVRRMEHAYETDDFPPKPSGLCRKWCKVTTCEFHGKGAF